RLEPAGDLWKIEDLGGLGLWVGGRKVPRAMLKGGDVVDVGGFPGAVSLAMPVTLEEPIALKLRLPNAPETFLLLQKLPMIMGRASWVDLPVPDPNVSHAHARLRLEDGHVVIDDLQSRNGTLVEGAAVRVSHPLRHGD